MKFKRGDLVLVDPMNKMNQTRIGSTIHGVVVERGWRKSYVMSIENYDVLRIPNSLLVKLPVKNTPINVVERSREFSPKFSAGDCAIIRKLRDDCKDEFLCLAINNILYKMSSDDISYEVSHNLRDRIDASPNVMLNVCDFINSKTTTEWEAINRQVSTFTELALESEVSDDMYMMLNNWANVADSCTNNRVISAVDEYFEGIPITSETIIECIREITGKNDLSKCTYGDSDIIVLTVMHAMTLAPEDEYEVLSRDILESLYAMDVDNNIMDMLNGVIESYTTGEE